jgi:hypothetical protein
MRAVQKADMSGGRARSLRIGRVVAGLGVALGLTSCSAIQHTVGGWFGAIASKVKPKPETTAATPASAPRAYYAGVEGLKVYSEASASSKVVGALSLHEKVTRSKLERGYAYVESSKSGLKGWVSNAKLTWRVPTAGAPATVEAEPEAPEVPEPQEPSGREPTPPAEEAPPTPAAVTVPAAPPTSTTTPRGIQPSIFNPY